MSARELKRSYVKEELFKLTGGTEEAIILDKLIRCQGSLKQVDAYLEEEKARHKANGIVIELAPTEGWFYKAAKDIIEECLLKMSHQKFHRIVEVMEEKGWVATRRNPLNFQDKIKQYRVEILRIQADLEEIGYTLEGWLFDRAAVAAARRGATERNTPDELKKSVKPEGSPAPKPTEDEAENAKLFGGNGSVKKSNSEPLKVDPKIQKIWDAYPKKARKPDGIVAIVNAGKRIRKGEEKPDWYEGEWPPENICQFFLDRIEVYAASNRVTDGFIQDCATWFNGLGYAVHESEWNRKEFKNGRSNASTGRHSPSIYEPENEAPTRPAGY